MISLFFREKRLYVIRFLPPFFLAGAITFFDSYFDPSVLDAVYAVIQGNKQPAPAVPQGQAPAAPESK